jgi:hypothetical protein
MEIRTVYFLLNITEASEYNLSRKRILWRRFTNIIVFYRVVTIVVDHSGHAV